MRPKKHKTTGSNDLFRARLDQIINLKHELVLLAGKIDWRSINVARNICAHHSRFWNKPSVVQPKWPSAVDCPDLGHIAADTHAQTRVYGMACLCAQLLKSINSNSQWSGRFKSIIASFPKSKIISLKSAGFPDDWDKANLWA